MSRDVCFPNQFPYPGPWVKTLAGYFKTYIAVLLVFISTKSFAQTFPPLSSCTSKDLELVGASLPAPANDPCQCSGMRTLVLTIANKTGSTRTSFALWGTLVRYNAAGTEISRESIVACAGPIPKNSTTPLVSDKEITISCGESLDIIDLYLAWTSASPGETCSVLKANPSTINPKCGTLPLIHVGIGVDGALVTTNATCSAGGSIKVTPSGGVGPYTVKLDNGTPVNVAAGAFTTFTNVSAGAHSVVITDSRNCSTTKNPSVGSPAAVTANAGGDFEKTCIANTSGQTIGEVSEAGFTYSWTPTAGLSATNVSNPTANPTSTTTYTVTKTNIATGCSDDDAVTVSVNTTAPTADAGDDFTKTCTSNSSGKQIGESNDAAFTYSWSPAGGLSATNISNPTANPTSTTTYTVTKTNITTGCTDDDEVIVTVNNAAVTANAGDDFTKTCTSNASGKQIGEANDAAFTYSWSPAGGLSAANISNPTANPTSTTTYTVTKTNITTGCTDDDEVIVTVNNAAVTANAGDDFTKTCTANASGKQIGEANDAAFTYSWSPAGGLSATNISNPTANPTSTTTYTVTKTNITTGCTDDDEVIVTVNNAAVTANAGDDFTKTCTSNASGKQIGEANDAAFTYSWSPAAGLDNASISNPTANPDATTIYTVTKTNISSGCSNTDIVTVTVDTETPGAPGICVVQPSLCGPTTGSVTILSPLGADYQYSIDNGGNWQSGAVFDNLAPGSVTGIKVKKLSSGCISTAVSCDASDCSIETGERSQTTGSKQTIAATTLNIAEIPVEQLTVKAFPNPYSDKVRLVISSPVAGQGSIEVVNMLGQKIKTVYQGRIIAGNQAFDVNIPSAQRSTLIYIFRMGGKQITGKLLQLNQ